MIVNCCNERRWCLNPNIVTIWIRVITLISKFEDVEIIYIPHSLNKVADAIAFSVGISFNAFYDVGNSILSSAEFSRSINSVLMPSLINCPFLDRFSTKRFRKPTYPVPSKFSLNSDDPNSIIFDINHNI
jgi:hypothetical protein